MIIAIIILSWLLINLITFLICDFIDKFGKFDKHLLFAIIVSSTTFSIGQLVYSIFTKIETWRKRKNGSD